MKVCINGKFVPARHARVSVFDSGFTSGCGIYETLRAENGEVLNLNKHVDRLFRSAKMVGLKLPWTRARIARWAKKIAGKGLMRIRITVSFGADPNYAPRPAGPQIVIFAVPMRKPGLKKSYNAITYNIERILPEAKTTCLLPQYLARRQKKADEILLVNHKNEVTEGSVTNVFFVKDRALITPKDGILRGTARASVIKAAKKLKIPISERAVKKPELKNFSECFVTNALCGVVPVLSIDGRRISAKIGPLTQKIRDYACKKN